MKKTVCMILALSICLGAAWALVSCGCSHVFAEEWSADDTHHWHACTVQDCDGKSDQAEHDWDDGVLSPTPTATTPGARRYICKTCGKIRTETVGPEPTVQETEWANAFLIPDENYWMTVSINGAEYHVVKRRNGIAVAYNPQAVDMSKQYYTFEDGKYYCYTETVGRVVKEEVSEQVYRQVVTLIDLQKFAYATFSFDDADKTYKAAQLTIDGIVYENVCISFQSGKITRLSFTKAEAGKESDVYGITITYGTVATDLVLPQVSG